MAVDKNKITAEATKLVQKGQWEKAIKAYEKILAEDSKDVRVLLKVGELHQKRGDSGAAANAFNRVADTYSEQGFFLKAVAVFKQIVKLTPDDMRVNERLASLYQQLGLMSDAMGQLQIVAGTYEKAGDTGRLTQVLRRMLELDSDNIPSSIKLGELLAKAGQNAEALKQFRHAADHLKKNNRIEDYVKVAERIAFLSPDDLALTRELANIYLAKSDTKRALAKLQLCFKANPRDIDTLGLLAQAFRDLGQLSKTVSVLKELANVHADAGRSDEARSTYRKVLEIAPDDPDAIAAIGPPAAPQPVRSPIPPPVSPRAPPPSFSTRAPPPPAAQAVSSGDRARAASPEASDSVAKLITETDVYVKYGLHDKALQHLKRVFALDPDNPDAHEKARDIQIASGNRTGAVDAAALLVRACLTHRLSDRARSALARLSELAPTHPDIRALSAAVGLPMEEPETLLVEPEEELLVEEPAPIEVDDDELALAAAGEEGEDIVDEERVQVLTDGAPSFDKQRTRSPQPASTVASRAAAPISGRAEARQEEADVSDELEEAEFYLQQGLIDEARDALENLLLLHPGHAAVKAKIDELDRKAASVAEASARAPLADESFDIAKELAEEVGESPAALSSAEEFQYSVDDVFSQFKKGVEKTVRPEDSQTHYDLGIAYKEMGLLDDAIHEFETAFKGPNRKMDLECLTMIGLSQVTKGDAQGAVATFRQALRLEKLSGDAIKALHYELAAAHEAAGEKEVALFYFQKIRKVDPAYRDTLTRVSALGGGPGRPPRTEAEAKSPPNGTSPLQVGPLAGRPGLPTQGKTGPKKNIGYV
jgi:tetratricopeptide (TPR) repeat protein